MNSIRKIALKSFTMNHPSPISNFNFETAVKHVERDDLFVEPPFEGDFAPIPEYHLGSLISNQKSTSIGKSGIFAFPKFSQGEQEPVELEILEQGSANFSFGQ